MGGWVDGWLGGWVDGWMGGWGDGEMGRWGEGLLFITYYLLLLSAHLSLADRDRGLLSNSSG
jgi:hypothetical protein